MTEAMDKGQDYRMSPFESHSEVGSCFRPRLVSALVKESREGDTGVSSPSCEPPRSRCVHITRRTVIIGSNRAVMQ